MTIEKFKFNLTYVGIAVIGILFLLMYAGKIDTFMIIWCELIIVFGYIAAVSDIKAKKISNSFVLVMLSAWAFTMTLKFLLDTDAATTQLVDAALGFILGGGLFLLIYIISRKGMGGGDVKFIAATGLYLGFAGVLSTILYGIVIAGVTSLVLLLLRKIGRKDTIPLAPFLYIGILITVFYR